MARIRMVTRTVEVTTATIMGLDTETAEVKICDYDVSGSFDSNDELLKTIKKVHETPTFKIVTVTVATTKSVLYGMPESDFIRLAEILPNR